MLSELKHRLQTAALAMWHALIINSFTICGGFLYMRGSDVKTAAAEIKNGVAKIALRKSGDADGK